MTRNILPKSDDMKIKDYFPLSISPATSSLNKLDTSLVSTSNAKSNSNSIRKISKNSTRNKTTSTSESSNNLLNSANVESNNNDDAIVDNTNMNQNLYQNIQIEAPFSRIRLNQWHTNEEIFNILTKCSNLSSLMSSSDSIHLYEAENELGLKICPKNLLNQWLTDEVVIRPNNGSVFLFDRRRVKNFKKDGFIWKRRKTGGANSVREDRMYLKINGTDSIYGCYSHSAIIPTFHRRCYWLLEKPDLILVHYLQTPNNETGECLINFNQNLFFNSNENSSINNQENKFDKDDLKSEIKSMIWPYYMSQSFINDNLKQINKSNLQQSTNYSYNDFLDILVSSLLDKNSENKNSQINTIRISLFFQYLNESLPVQDSSDTKKYNLNNDIKIIKNIISPNDKHDDTEKEASKNEKFSNINIQVSTNTCSSKGGEKLFFFGEFFQTNSIEKKSYKILINNIEIDLVKVTNNVLECTLPNFNLYNKNDDGIVKTSIHVLKDNSLYCSPIPFEINKAQHLDGDKIFKIKFTMLEKFILFANLFNFNLSNFYFYEETVTQDDIKIDNLIRFDKKLAMLFRKLIFHIQNFNYNNEMSNFISLKSNKSINNEGKTFFHLSAEAGFNCFFKALLDLMPVIVNILSRLNLLSEEFDITKKDNNNDMPIILASKNGNEFIALELANIHLSKLSCENLNKNDSLYLSILNAIEISKNNGYINLSQNLKNLLDKHEKRFSKENECEKNLLTDSRNSRLEKESIEKIKKSLTTSQINQCYGSKSIDSNIDHTELTTIPSPSINPVIDENFRLIENLDDLEFLLTDETVQNDILDHKKIAETAKSEIYLEPNFTSYSSNFQDANFFSNNLIQNNETCFNLDANDLSGKIFNNNQEMNNSSNKQHENSNEQLKQKNSASLSPLSLQLDDEQDKKIKALADNIIAAMPYKIKSNSYAVSNLNCNNQDQKIEYNNCDGKNYESLNNHNFNNMNRPSYSSNNNLASYEDNYEQNQNSINPRISLSSYQSSSTRSSLSPTTSFSFQYSNTSQLSDENCMNKFRTLEDSPGDDSSCSSTFHIDCTPSTAEFCQYFHASSSSGYYKNAIETGFAQLTLTDDEQRELYEAALVIQNAYRRYMLRKKKKIKLDTENDIKQDNFNTSFDSNSLNFSEQKISFNKTQQKSENTSLSRCSSTSLSSLNSINSYNSQNLVTNDNTFKYQAQFKSIQANSYFKQDIKPQDRNSDDDENNSSSEEHKQYEAACVIQKYYRRYKQYENLQKYNEAAVKIQTRYRAYKSSTIGSSKIYQLRAATNNQQFSLKNHYHHNSIDETSVSDFSTSNYINNSSNDKEAERRTSESDLQLNCYNCKQSEYQSMFNQKKVTRKLMNARQSSRFSPASINSFCYNSQNTPASSSTLSQKSFTISNNSQINNQNSYANQEKSSPENDINNLNLPNNLSFFNQNLSNIGKELFYSNDLDHLDYELNTEAIQGNSQTNQINLANSLEIFNNSDNFSITDRPTFLTD